MDNQDWFEQPEASEASLKQMSELCEQAFKLKEKIAGIENELGIYTEQLHEILGKLQVQLDTAGLDSFKSPNGTVFIQTRTSFRVPTTDENRAAFFNYLKSKGQFDSMITVHSQTLNAYCKKEVEEHLANGDTGFKIPGIEDPVVSKDLRMRRK